MNTQRPLAPSLVIAAALAMLGATTVATAQAPAQQAAPATSSPEFYPGTKSTATYPIQNGTLTVNAGMPDHVKRYGPPPAFSVLDTNHDGRISEAEAQAYPPLDGDFLFASDHGKSISRAQYEKWVKDQ